MDNYSILIGATLLKVQYDSEYENKLKHQLDVALANKLDEQSSYLKEQFAVERSSLIDEYRRELDMNLAELKFLKEKQTCAEKQYDELRLEKANLEIKANRVETELKEKCLGLEKLLLESGEKAKMEVFRAEKETNALRAELDSTNVKLTTHKLKLENDLADLSRNFEGEKVGLLAKIDELIREKEASGLRELELREKIQSSSVDFDLKIKSELIANSLKVNLGKKNIFDSFFWCLN
jgi:hypothetical protein